MTCVCSRHAAIKVGQLRPGADGRLMTNFLSSVSGRFRCLQHPDCRPAAPRKRATPTGTSAVRKNPAPVAAAGCYGNHGPSCLAAVSVLGRVPLRLSERAAPVFR